jgi:hypothetical protein
MTITKHYIDNLRSLAIAIRSGKVVLAKCTDATTGQSVITVCTIKKTGRMVEMIPLAKLFDGNPYHELLPPDTPALDAKPANA